MPCLDASLGVQSPCPRGAPNTSLYPAQEPVAERCSVGLLAHAGGGAWGRRVARFSRWPSRRQSGWGAERGTRAQRDAIEGPWHEISAQRLCTAALSDRQSISAADARSKDRHLWRRRSGSAVSLRLHEALRTRFRLRKRTLDVARVVECHHAPSRTALCRSWAGSIIRRSRPDDALRENLEQTRLLEAGGQCICVAASAIVFIMPRGMLCSVLVCVHLGVYLWK